ncbi:MutS-related protein [Ornithobacterium rhinotracheale]|uniref:Mismatch repair ATPase (MutS family) n=2 Tax=Ornithobacterium rhinotracheale TaxID=28251 RepID=I3ZXS8_ORNRL|nr:mismatch repair ATPase [Ornithobacterium rhinotracheale]AFL96512.1 mismatch repair ATPase (MutS family) [Ornithobacterium rhinotracheale DSM 15997]UVD87563.1 DNA mismatch repair protein [Ornithobacterium rhinotracheale]
MNIYLTKIKEHKQTNKNLKRNLFIIIALRFLLFSSLTFLIFKYESLSKILFFTLVGFFLIVFIFIFKIHSKLKNKLLLTQNLIQINQKEYDFLTENKKPFSNGAQWIDPTHNYTFDLDIFGESSLFHYLNRCASILGERNLAQKLSSGLGENEITANQSAIQELSKKIDFRQFLLAHTMQLENEEKNYQQLLNWANKKSKFNFFFNFMLYLSPALFIISVGASVYDLRFLWLSLIAFSINCFILLFFYKPIMNEIAQFERISAIIQIYSQSLSIIEKEHFNDKKLNELKQKIQQNTFSASQEFKQLARIFSDLEGIFNIAGALVFNGSVLYHIHIFKRLFAWKEKNVQNIEFWTAVIGEFEMLNSLANFAYNNPSYCFPHINQNNSISFENMSHPLINTQNRIGNTIDFNPQHFVILTGANMSGKSTFLRALGVNLVLAKIGSPICARHANIQPMNILVSMRQTDSLNDGKSLFYAEILRLKQIIYNLKTEKSFVLLDEILRGTNSEDKQLGTQKIVEEILNLKAFGCLATHDLVITEMAKKYPTQLANKYFETRVINNQLAFDYRLREGISNSKNALHLMESLGIFSTMECK